MKKIIICCTAMLFLLCPGTGFADDLLMGFYNMPPYQFTMNGRAAGIDTEILQEMASRMGVKLQYQTCSFEECLESMRTGSVDVMAGLFRNSDREKYIRFMLPSYSIAADQVFYVLKGQENRISNYSDLSGLKIGTIQGADYFPRFDKDTSLNKITAGAFPELVSMLDNGMIDCFVCSYSEGDFWLRVLGRSDIIVPAKFLYSGKQNMWMGFSKASPNRRLAGPFRRALESVISDGSVERIERRFIKR